MKRPEIEKRVARLKPGETFEVTSKGEQSTALHTAKILCNAGVIKHRILTRKSAPGRWTVLAF